MSDEGQVMNHNGDGAVQLELQRSVTPDWWHDGTSRVVAAVFRRFRWRSMQGLRMQSTATSHQSGAGEIHAFPVSIASQLCATGHGDIFKQ